jgi:hypothetical protein
MCADGGDEGNKNKLHGIKFCFMEANGNIFYFQEFLFAHKNGNCNFFPSLLLDTCTFPTHIYT